jgi:hypothetical protein
MSLQNRTIERYRLFFPQETLREVSARTGIQITRVFRLFNGKPMKLGEFEAFEKAISEKIAENPSFARLNYIVEEASSLLTNEEIGRLADYMERKIANKKYVRTYVRPIFEDAIIA